jgi:hypothetical protein
MPTKKITCKDIAEKLQKIDKHCFPFLSLDETEMIVMFDRGKKEAIEKYLKSMSLDYSVEDNRIRIRIKKI